VAVVDADVVDVVAFVGALFLFNKFWKKFFKLLLSGAFDLALGLSGDLIVGGVVFVIFIC
jgi:hypothetical protein